MDSRRMKQREGAERSRCARSSTVGSDPGGGLWIWGPEQLEQVLPRHPWQWQGDCNKTPFMVLPNHSVIL